MGAPVFPAGYFLGDTTSIESSGVVLSEVRHRVGRYVEEHTHQAAYFGLLLEGTYAEWGDGFDFVYEPYTLVFHAEGTLHEDEIGASGSRFFALALLEPWLTVIEELGGARAHVFELDGGEPVWLMLRLYREFVAGSAISESAVEGLVYELCTHVAKRTTDDATEPPWLGDIDRLVRERFREPLNLRGIAATASVHPAHLCRTYRHFRGRTLSDAIIGMRVQHVCRRLDESDDSLTAIAAEAGFSDQSHMTNTFKRATGHTPGAHRKLEGAKLVQDPPG
jgi:AraC family transcriptional regulator